MPFADANQRRAYHRDYYRPYRLACYRRYRDAGACGNCGLPVERFAKCNKCRAKDAQRKRHARAALKSEAK